MLPTVITESDDYRSLSERKKEIFDAQIHHFDDIAKQASSISISSMIDVLNALDDLELDAYAIIGARSSDEAVSPYILHSSWTFSCSRSIMADAIPDSFKSQMLQSLPPIDAPPKEIVAWLHQWGRLMSELLEKLRTSASFDSAIAQCLAIDTLMAQLISVLAMTRVNRNFE